MPGGIETQGCLWGTKIATVGGGLGNVATGSYAVTPGGFANQAAGDYSFAAGRSAKVGKEHTGAFLFADASPFAFPSLASNEFAVRATGGVRFVTAVDASGNLTSGVRLSPGSGAWESSAAWIAARARSRGAERAARVLH